MKWNVKFIGLYFFKRYEITTASKPHYQSQTCIIHFAIDNYNGTTRPVALKFVKYKESLINEVEIRAKGDFDSQYVLDVITHYDSDSDPEFHKCIVQRGFANYPYLLVLPAGDRNLNEIITNGYYCCY